MSKKEATSDAYQIICVCLIRNECLTGTTPTSLKSSSKSTQLVDMTLPSSSAIVCRDTPTYDSLEPLTFNYLCRSPRTAFELNRLSGFENDLRCRQLINDMLLITYSKESCLLCLTACLSFNRIMQNYRADFH